MSTSRQDCHLSWATTALACLACFLSISLSTLCCAGTSLSQSPYKDELGYPTNSAAARELGMAEARRDLSNGVFIVKTAGLPSLDRPVYEQLFKEHCNATLQPIAGCIVTSGLRAYMSGYDEVSTAAIKQRYGTDIFDKLGQEAKIRFEKRFADAASRSPTARQRTYLVKPGETLTQIAFDHGISLKTLSRANPGVEPTRLQVNQRLVIPVKAQP